MPSLDLSRHTTDPRKHYAGVRMQQGRVLTDDDFNEHARLDAEDLRRTRVDTIGPAGSPDHGFLVANPVIDAGTGRPTFTISAGTFYLGGQRLVLEADEPYHLQKDWLQNGAGAGDPILSAPAGERFDFAWLETWQQPVSAVEDGELLEVALGGPDTAGRVRNFRRVRVLPGVAGGDCNAAWAALRASLAGDGTVDTDCELVPDARLRVEPDGTSGAADLCSPPVAGGYLGAENQAIRVQLVGANEFTWGYDNASPLYRVQLGVDNTAQRRRVTMLTLPKDQAHWPLVGQVVELLPWAAVLANKEKIAGLRGHLAKVTVAYDPNAKTFDFDVVPPADASGRPFGETYKNRSDAAALGAGGEFFYLRVWNRGSDTASAARLALTPGTAVSLAHTGLKVTFSGAHLRPGDFWIIAARPDAADTVVPWELATGRRPHGIRRWIAPLAVLRWPGGPAAGTVVNDCRETFLPLTRIRNCCTVTVGDGNESHGHFTSVQAAVNSLPAQGGRVCVLPGRYEGNVRLVNRHGIVISGCGPRTRLVGRAPSGGADAAPVIEIVGGHDLGLEDFAVEAFDTGLGIELIGRNGFSREEQEATSEVIEISLSGLSVAAGQRSALSGHFVRQLVVRDCAFSNRDVAGLEPTVTLLADDVAFVRNLVEVAAAAVGAPAGGPPAAFAPGTNARGGLQLEGTSERVLVRDNLIRGGSSHGIVLGSVEEVADPADVGPVRRRRWRIIDPCDPRADLDISVENDPKKPGVGILSTGPLEHIRITGNRIHDHGGCGIGVVHFWNLNGADDFIEVVDLVITDNTIQRCLQRGIPEPSVALASSIGYGGIALGSVENLVIHRNLIARNGVRPGDPVCGVFVLHGEGIEITANRILDNGVVAVASADTVRRSGATPKRGLRGGIVVVYALAPTRLTTIDSPFGLLADRAPLQAGEPAARIHDNIVTTPLGQALALNALGPVTVQANQFTTRGIATAPASPGFAAAAVWILNLGLSNEFFLQQIAFSALGRGTAVDPMGALNPSRLDDFVPGRIMANGQVLFTDNQVNLDLLAVGQSLSLSSVFILTLDDIGFHDNPCEANLYLLDDLILTQALLVGMTLRASGNRFKEGLLSAFFSAVTLGVLANTTALNQGTHCIATLGFYGTKRLDSGNIALIGPNPLLTWASNDKDITCDSLQEKLQDLFAKKST